MIGLIGASGVGKTTLAKKFAKKSGFVYVESSVRGVFESMGLDPKVDYDFDTRLKIQIGILEASKASYQEIGSSFISDRTPLDLLAYTIADVGRENLNEQQSLALLDYVDECFHATNTYFSAVILVQPGIPMSSDGIRPTNLAYMEHIAIILMGLLADQRLNCAKSFINRNTLDLSKRIGVVESILGKVHLDNAELAKISGVH